jgi:hypothetical protein
VSEDSPEVADEEPGPPEQDVAAEEGKVGAATVAALLILIGGFGWLAYRAYPAHHPENRNPSFIDSIFANNLVLFAARLVLASAAFVLAVTAIYIIWSMIKWMTAGRMLAKFGPFEVHAVEDFTTDVEMWRDLLEEANQENEQLRRRVEQAAALLAHTHQAFRGATQGQEGSSPTPTSSPASEP